MIVLEAESRAVLGSFPVPLRRQVVGERVEATVRSEDDFSSNPPTVDQLLEIVSFKVEAVWDRSVPPRPTLVLLFAGDRSKLARVGSFRGRRS